MALEFEYLATLTRDYIPADRPASRPPADLDWFRFIQLCLDNRVAGTLLPLVPREGLPREIIEKLDEAQRLMTEATILRLLFLERILPELEKAGCRPIVLKGGVLATLYKLPQQRFLADLDILVEPDQLERTCSALQGLGLQFTHTKADPRYYQDHHFHWIMDNGAGFIVEVHWALTMPHSIYCFDLAGLHARAHTLPLNKTTMRVPAPVDLLLHVVTQCTGGGFGEMRLVIDAALLYPTVEGPDALIRQALDQNQGTALWLLLAQVASFTGTPISRDLLDRLAPGKNTARLLVNLANRMLGGRGEFRHRGEIPHLLHWLCAPTNSLRRRELRRFLFPGEEYWLEIGFPPQAFPGPLFRLTTRLSRLKTLLYLAGTAVITLFRPSSSSPPRELGGANLKNNH